MGWCLLPKISTFFISTFFYFHSFQTHVHKISNFQWVEAFNNFKEAIELMKPEPKKSTSIIRQFWGAHQRFFKYMCIASKIKFAVEAAQKAVKDGKCVVIGLQSTGEARTLEELALQGGKLDDFVSTAK